MVTRRRGMHKRRRKMHKNMQSTRKMHNKLQSTRKNYCRRITRKMHAKNQKGGVYFHNKAKYNLYKYLVAVLDGAHEEVNTCPTIYNYAIQNLLMNGLINKTTKEKLDEMLNNTILFYSEQELYHAINTKEKIDYDYIKHVSRSDKFLQEIKFKQDFQLIENDKTDLIKKVLLVAENDLIYLPIKKNVLFILALENLLQGKNAYLLNDISKDKIISCKNILSVPIININQANIQINIAERLRKDNNCNTNNDQLCPWSNNQPNRYSTRTNSSNKNNFNADE